MHQNNLISAIVDPTPSRLIKCTPNLVLKCMSLLLRISEIKLTFFFFFFFSKCVHNREVKLCHGSYGDV
jgi:hypothetical protein